MVVLVLPELELIWGHCVINKVELSLPVSDQA